MSLVCEEGWGGWIRDMNSFTCLSALSATVAVKYSAICSKHRHIPSHILF